MAGDLGEVFHERGDEWPRGAGAGAGGEQVERAVLGEEVAWVELLAGLGADGVQDAGSARQERAWATAIQMESRVRGSELIMPSSESDQPAAAWGWLARMPTASVAAEADSDHSKRARVGSCSSAAAWSSAWSAERALPSQKPPDSTPPEESPVDDARPDARIIAVSGSSQPRIGDQRTPLPPTAGSPAVRCCGSKTATGPRSFRASMVAAMLSGRVEVVTTAPGASRMALMTRCSPLPERGGPITRIESSTDAQISRPQLRPSR